MLEQRFNLYLPRVCFICERYREAIVGDHDHITGRARGKICAGCNSRLTAFERNIYHFGKYSRTALKYLYDHGSLYRAITRTYVEMFRKENNGKYPRDTDFFKTIDYHAIVNEVLNGRELVPNKSVSGMSSQGVQLGRPKIELVERSGRSLNGWRFSRWGRSFVRDERREQSR